MAYTDKTLTCVDCQTTFIFSARDQEFHASKGFANEPKRCPNCRQARRAQRGEAPAAAGAQRTGGAPVYSGPRAQSQPRAGGRDFNRPRGPRRDFDRGGRDDGAGMTGSRSFDGSGGNGSQHEAPRTYTATCVACGKETAIPADAGNRVIFCQECSSKMAAMASS